MKELIFHLTDYETMTFFVSYFVLLSLCPFTLWTCMTLANCWIFDSFVSLSVECSSRPVTLLACMTKTYWWYLCVFICRVLESSSDMATTLIGTPYYMSPELFSNKPYNHKVCVWFWINVGTSWSTFPTFHCSLAQEIPYLPLIIYLAYMA